MLNDTSSGWFGPDALAKMPRFAEDFVCEPARPHYGFTSWDDFFTRQFLAGAARRLARRPGRHRERLRVGALSGEPERQALRPLS